MAFLGDLNIVHLANFELGVLSSVARPHELCSSLDGLTAADHCSSPYKVPKKNVLGHFLIAISTWVKRQSMREASPCDGRLLGKTWHPGQEKAQYGLHNEMLREKPTEKSSSLHPFKDGSYS